MKTAFLIEELISIAGITKKDFAAAVLLSPSGLSRFLSGQQALDLRAHERFSSGAAQILTTAIFEPGCHLRLSGLFPFIYEFTSRNDLQIFLNCAIAYALDYDFAADYNIYPDYQEKESFYYKQRQVLNMSCIILSDFLQQARAEDLEFYSTMPLIFGELPYSLQRVFFNNSHQQKISWHQSLNFKQAALATDYVQVNNPFGTIHRLEENFDLYLWETNNEDKQYYLLLKNHCLLIFGALPDAAPTLKVIRNKNYLLRFLQFIDKSWGRKQSFNGEEARQLLDRDPALLTGLLDDGLQAVYNFVPVNYVLTAAEMAETGASLEERERMQNFLHAIIRSDADFYYSSAAISEFSRSGKAIVPLTGLVTVAEKKRVELLQRLEAEVSPAMRKRSRLIYTSMSNAAILCTRDLCLLYMINQDGSREKIHLFLMRNIAEYLEEDYRQKQFRLVDFSQSRWQAYLDEVASRFS